MNDHDISIIITVNCVVTSLEIGKFIRIFQIHNNNPRINFLNKPLVERKTMPISAS